MKRPRTAGKRPLPSIAGIVRGALGASAFVGVVAFVGFVAGVAGVVACGSTSTTTTFTPITGVLVRSDALTSGIGCGTAGGQIYKYAAVVTQNNQTLVLDNVGVGTLSECYADTKFANLLAGPDGTLSFDVQIYAFSLDSYNAQVDKGLATAVGDWTALQTFQPTYKTSCHATQQQNIEVLAVCDPLKVGGAATVRIDTSSFPRAAGAPYSCKTDGGAGDYGTVQAFYQVNGGAGELTHVTCPDALVVTPAQAPATYTFDVQLVDPAGAAVVATTHCSATTIPGLETTATCDPAQ